MALMLPLHMTKMYNGIDVTFAYDEMSNDIDITFAHNGNV